MVDEIAVRNRPSSSRLLARILETPHLAEQIQALPAPVLLRLIDRIGLEDAGELVAFATTEQLALVFDEDLWRSERAGEDERFDAARFLVWLAIMREAGDSFVARKLAELPEDLVTLAFHRQILVVRLDDLMAEIQDAGDESSLLEKALSNCLSEELDEFQIISRRQEGWDDVLAAILALDRDHHDYLLGILERCSRMSAEYVEDNGSLYDVLTSEEMLEADVAAEREDRRAEAGHVSPSSAAGFLKLARAPLETSAPERDPLTRAYFRGLARQEAGARSGGSAERGRSAAPGSEAGDLARLLGEAGIVESAADRLLLGAAPGERPAAEPLVIRALRRLSEREPDKFFERSEELAYLANVLAAGCSFQGRRLRPIEAVRAAIATCSLGLELSLRAAKGKRRDEIDVAARALRELSADGLFRIAWGRLHHEIVGRAAEAAERLLREAAARDEAKGEKALLRSAARLRAAAAQGAPWKAAPEIDSLVGARDAAVVEALRGLVDECPSLRGALAGRAGAGEPSGSDEHRFITRLSELSRVREFLRAPTTRSS